MARTMDVRNHEKLYSSKEWLVNTTEMTSEVRWQILQSLDQRFLNFLRDGAFFLDQF